MFQMMGIWEDDTTAKEKSFGCDLSLNSFDMVEDSDTIKWIENKITLWSKECEI